MKTENNKRKVLITGSTSGIGKCIADGLLFSGYSVFTTGRKVSDRPDHFCSDLSKLNEVKLLYEYVKDNFGDIDILINNAGEYIYSEIEKISVDDIVHLFNLNFLSHYYLTGLTVPSMKQKKWGRIINISSISGVLGEANASLYSSSKSAFYGFSKSLALELCPYNITVNSISPGWVETPLNDNYMTQDDKNEVLDVVPQKRFIEPVEILNLVKYLISDSAKGLTGQNINLCAGMTCGC